MKYAVTILLLAIVATCVSAQYVTTWGVQTGRLLAEERVVVSSGWLQVRERTVTFRSVSAGLNLSCFHFS